MRRIAAVIGFICGTVCTILPCCANETVSCEEKWDYLRSIGCTEEYLAMRDEESIDKLYDYLFQKNVKFIDCIMSDGDIEENMQRGTIDTDKFQWAMGIFCEENEALEVTALDIELYGRWVSNPFIALEDAITVNWDGTLFKLENFNTYCSDHYAGYYYESNALALVESGGLGYDVPLQTGNNVLGNPTVESFIQLLPREGALQDGAVYDTTITAHYYHQIIGGDLSFGVSAGVGSSPEYSAGVTITSGNYDSLAIWANGVFDGKYLRGFTYHNYEELEN